MAVISRDREWLEFAAFSVKSRPMTRGGDGVDRSRCGRWLLPMLALALLCAISAPVHAQWFSDRPPPVPPASVPDPGAAVSLAPPSGPASAPNLPPQLTQPPPPTVAPPNVVVPSQGVLALSARYGKDLP